MRPKVLTMMVRVAVILILCVTMVAGRLPNIVILLADDLGMGDVGCFGNTTLRTPHIDSIARQGVKLNQHITAAAICTPSRAALLTGRYPVRMGIASPHTMGVLGLVASSGGLPQNETTFAKILKQKGYNTALIGKWHLGVSCDRFDDFCHHPLNHGFDYFYGLPLTNLKDFIPGAGSVITAYSPQFFNICSVTSILGFVTVWYLSRRGYCGLVCLTLSVTCLVLFTGLVKYSQRIVPVLNSIIMRDFDVVEQQISAERMQNLSKRFVAEGKRFIESQRRTEKPFLLFVSWAQVHTALHASKPFRGRSQHGRYGDEVEELDWSVGQILGAIESNGFKSNTFVYFSSDNGGHVEETEQGQRAGGFNGIYKGGKMQGSTEGGIRVPTAAMWPGFLPVSAVIEEPVSMMDVFPTVVKMAGAQLPSDRLIDGRDMLPLLQGVEDVSPHEFLFHYCQQDIHAVRYRPKTGSSTWKVHFVQPNWLQGTEGCNFKCSCYNDVTWLDEPRIYDVTNDPSEKRPVAASTETYRQILTKVRSAVENHRLTVTPVPNQLSFGNVVWKPWLQPCCSFPSCKCKDDVYPD